jgi:hypothetical protein
MGVHFYADSAGAIRNTTLKHADTALDLDSAGTVTLADSLIEECYTGLRTRGDSAPVATNLNTHSVYYPVDITEDSKPSFTGGVWDGGGMAYSGGRLAYDGSGTPDPVFSGVTLQNMNPAGGHAAIDLDASWITGTTHWQGIPFWINSSILIGDTARVDAFDTTLSFEPGMNVTLDVEGTLNLGSPTGPLILHSGSASPNPGDWMGVRFQPGSTGAVRNASLLHADTALDLDTTGAVAITDSLVEQCYTGIRTRGLSAPVVTGLNAVANYYTVDIIDDSRPTFTGGVWDGGGMAYSGGRLFYDASGTPDPVFSDITLQNMNPSGGHAAIDIEATEGVHGATHWRGVPFWIYSMIQIPFSGRVDASATTLYFDPDMGTLEVMGTLNLGLPAEPVLLRSGNSIPAAGDWQGIHFNLASTGNIRNTTIRHADTALYLINTGAITITDTLIAEGGIGILTAGISAPVVTNLNSIALAATVDIGGNSAPSFTGGIWDGGGTAYSAGRIVYDPDTPDPSFSGITIQNMNPAGGQPAIEIDAGTIAGTTHWSGTTFWLNNRFPQVAPTGRLDIYDCTVLAWGVDAGLWALGEMNIGLAGAPVTIRSTSPSPDVGDWIAIEYGEGATGTVQHATVQDCSICLSVISAEDIRVQDTTVRHAGTGMQVGELSATIASDPILERTQFEDCETAVRVWGAGQPDLGGGAHGSTGHNTLVGTALSLDNGTTIPTPARYNWWGCPTAIEMDTQAANISLINDFQDDPGLGAVDYAGWLDGGIEWTHQAAADTQGGVRDVVLSWTAVPAGPLHIMRGTNPTLFEDRAQTTGQNYRDVGALDDPNPILYYKVTGPCME